MDNDDILRMLKRYVRHGAPEVCHPALASFCEREITQANGFKYSDRMIGITWTQKVSTMQDTLQATPTWRRTLLDDSGMGDEALAMFQEAGGLLVEAPPGYGKTYLVLLMVERLRALGKRVALMSFTNTGANQLGDEARTIHRHLFMGLDGQINKAGFKLFAGSYDVVVVDEISMNPHYIWYALGQLKVYCPRLTFILVGDRHQCPKVETYGSDPRWPHYFEHPTVRELAANRSVSLRKRQRSKCPELDAVIDGLLEQMGYFLRLGLTVPPSVVHPTINTFPSPAPGELLDRNICYLVATEKAVNCAINRKYAATKDVWFTTEAHPGDDRSQPIHVYEGLPLRGRVCRRKPFDADAKKSPKNIISTNERFVVTGHDPAAETVELQAELTGRKLLVPRRQLTTHFYLAYCTTVHSCQGATIKWPIKVAIWDWELMMKELRYTAVSRVEYLAQLFTVKANDRLQLRAIRAAQALEAAQLLIIRGKLDKLREADRRAGRLAAPLAEEAEDPDRAARALLAGLKEVDFMCQRCGERRVRLVAKHLGADDEWVLDRTMNEGDHTLDNLGHCCFKCNNGHVNECQTPVFV